MDNGILEEIKDERMDDEMYAKLGREAIDILGFEEDGQEPGFVSEQIFLKIQERLESMTDLELLRLFDQLVSRGVFPAVMRDEWFDAAVKRRKLQREVEEQQKEYISVAHENWELKKENRRLKKWKKQYMR
jgi:hypothetical protein